MVSIAFRRNGICTLYLYGSTKEACTHVAALLFRAEANTPSSAVYFIAVFVAATSISEIFMFKNISNYC